ncbi:MAG TPA: hypothetical protein VGM37_10730 [Armatimonadota bacterium]
MLDELVAETVQYDAVRNVTGAVYNIFERKFTHIVGTDADGADTKWNRVYASYLGVILSSHPF